MSSTGYHSLGDLLSHDGLEKAKNAIPTVPKESEAFTYLAPVQFPDKVLCVGMNYVDHCLEQNIPPPKEPVFFNKFASSLAGAYDSVPLHPDVTKLDWEVELVIVIGKKCVDVSEAEALDYVFGYAVGHDVSAREWQLEKNGGQWLLGKARSGYGPFGPSVVTKDEAPDIHERGIRCFVNGRKVQDSSTKQMVFKTEALVSFVSKRLELLPGDVIFTGTPPGVGHFMKQPMYLKAGDVVECEIDGLGKTKNVIVNFSKL